ncbi:MAG: sensor histidine kinase [Acidimicrobiales bacterium]
MPRAPDPPGDASSDPHVAAQYAAIAVVSPTGLTLWHHQSTGGVYTLVEANDSARRIAGLDTGSVGRSAEELSERFAPFSVLATLTLAYPALEHTSHGTFDILDPSGQAAVVEVDAFVLGETSVAVMLRDVTARARAERERSALLGLLDDAEDAERRRLAEALHDDTIQVLAAANVELGGLRRRTRDPATVHTLERIEGRVRAASQALRSLVFELYPPDLGVGGIASGLRTLVDRLFADQPDVVADVVDELRAPPHTATCASAYRVAQEALRNVAQHARASHVEVRLGSDGDMLVLVVRDDGVGIGVDPDDAARRPGHLGMRTMRERAERHGGALSVRRVQPSGTEIELRIPDSPAGHGPA